MLLGEILKGGIRFLWKHDSAEASTVLDHIAFSDYLLAKLFCHTIDTITIFACRRELKKLVGCHIRLADGSMLPVDTFAQLWNRSLDPYIGRRPRAEDFPEANERIVWPRRSERPGTKRARAATPEDEGLSVDPEELKRQRVNQARREYKQKQKAEKVQAVIALSAELEDSNLFYDILNMAELSKGPAGRFYAIDVEWNGETSKSIQKQYLTSMNHSNLRSLINMIGNKYGDDWRDHVFERSMSREEQGLELDFLVDYNTL